VLRLALHRPEGEKRPRQLEGIRLLRQFRLGGGSLERSDCAFAVAPRGEEKPPGTMREGARRCLGPGGVLLEQIEETLGGRKLADGDERLDCDGACDLGAIFVHVVGRRKQGLDVCPCVLGVPQGELERRQRPTQLVSVVRDAGPLRDLEQVGSLCSDSFDLASLRSNLNQDVPAERKKVVPARLTCNLHRLVTEPGRPVPFPGHDLELGEEEQSADNPRIAPLAGLGDQLFPHHPRLRVAVAAAQNPGQNDSRIVALTRAFRDLDSAVQQIPAETPGAPKRDSRERDQADGERLRLSQFLGEDQCILGVPCAGLGIPSGGRHPCKLAENMRLLSLRETGLGERTAMQTLSPSKALR
jgi:hypothetical protein